MTQASKRTHRLAVAAMLSAVAAVLQFVEFSIPLIPSFVKLDISDLPALLGTFSLGPVYGVVIQLVKNLLHLPFGSSAGVGELSNFILGAVFVLCAGLVYRKHKSRKGALIGAMLGAVLMAVVSVPSNYFFVYPAICQGVRDAPGGHHRCVPGHSGYHCGGPLLQRSAQLPAGVQRALHLLQGSAGREPVLPDLQASVPPAAQIRRAVPAISDPPVRYVDRGM